MWSMSETNSCVPRSRDDSVTFSLAKAAPMHTFAFSLANDVVSVESIPNNVRVGCDRR